MSMCRASLLLRNRSRERRSASLLQLQAIPHTQAKSWARETAQPVMKTRGRGPRRPSESAGCSLVAWSWFPRNITSKEIDSPPPPYRELYYPPCIFTFTNQNQLSACIDVNNTKHWRMQLHHDCKLPHIKSLENTIIVGFVYPAYIVMSSVTM